MALDRAVLAKVQRVDSVARRGKHPSKRWLAEKILASVFLIEQEHAFFLIGAGCCLSVTSNSTSAIHRLTLSVSV